MSFTKKVKLEVKQESAFRCCKCQGFGNVEVHHIISESEEGTSNNIDNAAPICPNCHTNFGGNPDKRKVIRPSIEAFYDLNNCFFLSTIFFNILLM